MTTFKTFLMGAPVTKDEIATITSKHAQDAMYRMAKLLKLPDAEISHNQINSAVRAYVTDIFVVEVGDIDEGSADFMGSMLSKDLVARLKALLGPGVKVSAGARVLGAAPSRYLKIRAESEPV